MTALLTDNLPLLAGAPNGIKKLRELILELAVRGKLVPQDPNDEPASELLKRIAEEKARLEANGKTQKQKSFKKIGDDEKSFDLPERWAWQRFGQVFSLEYGDNLPANKRSNTGEYPVYGSNGIVGTHNTYFVGSPCIVVGRKGSAGALNLCHSSGCCVTDVAYYCVPPSVFSLDYVFKLFHTLGLDSLGKGIKPGLNRNEAYALVVAIPPLAEQHRIVAKVDELMALCDRLEGQQADAESAHAQLAQALLGSLTQATDAEDFAASWQRLAEHFHTLFTTEPSIDALKQTLLQLAVMGKLVPQDPSDEPASELLKRIAEEKARLVAEGKIRKQKLLGEIAAQEKPFVIPTHWEWVRLDSVLKKIGAGSTPLGGKQAYVADGVKFIRSQNVWNEGLRLNDVAFIPEKTHQKMSGTHVEAGDLLFNITGASIGRCAAVPPDFDTGNVSQHVTIIRPVSGDTQPFLHVVLISQLVQQTVMDVQVGVSREGLSIGKLSQFLIPFPPEAEQHRIVAKVDQLMALCDKLKARLTQARQLNAQLATALVEQAVA
ncbi:restriction endonuclease subunit S [Stutzerimonas stutzeri]|uniref:restriction endonuclease subunit S n=2 Tax=Stutzerimonas stutzeri TaxID=316 RepID=UPI000F7A3C86|nr:restriction endonuclease subunit S [Stutzerimonas stutzeri]RRW08412.1 restriction endonuclease subunit S [Stutzerimonas stutzeri]